jgi:hypothetical protein
MTLFQLGILYRAKQDEKMNMNGWEGKNLEVSLAYVKTIPVFWRRDYCLLKTDSAPWC